MGDLDHDRLLHTAGDHLGRVREPPLQRSADRRRHRQAAAEIKAAEAAVGERPLSQIRPCMSKNDTGRIKRSGPFLLNICAITRRSMKMADRLKGQNRDHFGRGDRHGRRLIPAFRRRRRGGRRHRPQRGSWRAVVAEINKAGGKAVFARRCRRRSSGECRRREV